MKDHFVKIRKNLNFFKNTVRLTCHPNNGNITNRVKAIALLGDWSAFADAPIISNFEFPSGNSVEELHISGHDKMPSLELKQLEALEVLYVTENALLSSLVLTGLKKKRKKENYDITIKNTTIRINGNEMFGCVT